MASCCVTGASIGSGEGEGWVKMGGSWRVACEGCDGFMESFMSVC